MDVESAVSSNTISLAGWDNPPENVLWLSHGLFRRVFRDYSMRYN